MVFCAHYFMGDGMRGPEQKSHHSRLLLNVVGA